jgi:AmmeMemoRadiSam system protein B
LAVRAGAYTKGIVCVFFDFFGFSLHPGVAGIKLDYVEEIITLEGRVRSPIVGGMFYPEDKADVLTCLRSFELERGKGGCASAIIAPHGAWEISGALAGAAFARAGGRVSGGGPLRVVVLGPVHDRQKEGIFLSNSHSFQTPLGDIQVDQEITEALESCSPLFEINDIPHLREHSIEVLLPFIKYCFPHAVIVPILMGRPRMAAVSALAYALRIVFEPIMEDTLLVVSFNLALHSSEAAALGMAEEWVRLFTGGQTAELISALTDGRLNTCGGALVASLLKSGLVEHLRPRCAAHSLLSARDEENKTVYYGAFSFE